MSLVKLALLTVLVLGAVALVAGIALVLWLVRKNRES